MVEHYCNKEKEIAEMHTNITWIKDAMRDMKKTLVGNGKPGLIDQMNELQTIKKQMVWLMTGAGTSLVAASVALLKVLQLI